MQFKIDLKKLKFIILVLTTASLILFLTTGSLFRPKGLSGRDRQTKSKIR